MNQRFSPTFPVTGCVQSGQGPRRLQGPVDPEPEAAVRTAALQRHCQKHNERGGRQGWHEPGGGAEAAADEVESDCASEMDPR
jgi:hypothetical protein